MPTASTSSRRCAKRFRIYPSSPFPAWRRSIRPRIWPNGHVWCACANRSGRTICSAPSKRRGDHLGRPTMSAALPREPAEAVKTKTPRRGGASGALVSNSGCQEPFISRTLGVLISRTLGVDLRVTALGVPFVDDIVELLDVALGIELQCADHGIPGAGLDGVHHLLRIGGLGLCHGLRPDLHCGVGVERIALGVDVLRLELLDNRLGGRLVARIGTEGEQRAF